MQSYDKISFKNDFVREEFITTLKREDIPDEMIIHKSNEGVYWEREDMNDTASSVVSEDIIKYGRENFGVNENTPKNEGVKEDIEGVNTKNEGVSEKINQELGVIYDFIKENPLVKTSAIEQFSKKSNATIERYLKILKDKGLIERFGSDKTGGYRIVIDKQKNKYL